MNPNPFKAEQQPTLSAEQALDVVMDEQVSQLMGRLTGASHQERLVEEPLVASESMTAEHEMYAQYAAEIAQAEQLFFEIDTQQLPIGQVASVILKMKKDAGQPINAFSDQPDGS